MRTAADARPHLPGLARIDEAAGDRQFAIALARGLEVLRAFGPGDRALSHGELCERTGLAKATVSRFVHTLTLLGYLSRGPDQRLSLGAGVLALGYPLLAGMPVRQIARPWLERLAHETGCTVNLGIRDRLCAVYLDCCRADRGNAWRPDTGTPLPLLTTAIGRALLLARPAAEQQAILNRLKVDDPRRFRDERPLYDADREAFRRRGWTIGIGHWRPDIHAVAMPLHPSVHRETVAINCTLSVGTRSAADVRRRIESVVPAMQAAARRIEAACADEPSLHRSPGP
ncbi:MAG TPA: IclR family transcriptional regulator [Burkholderiaceae bacterium]|nr:IclR family transcriptional regulator [Burkholderiaceae bacterium]